MIPERFTEVALRYVTTIKNGTTPATGDESLWDGGILWVTPDDLGKLDDFRIETTRRTVTPRALATTGLAPVPVGTVVISTRAPIGYLGITTTEATLNQGCKALVCGSRLFPKFVFYFMQHKGAELDARANGTTFKELPADELGAVHILVPPLPEQVAIAGFLDRETAKIDGLIEKLERLIALLEEKRQAVITHAVTKGLDPSAPMKDSGIDWLGEIPAHWDVKPLMRLVPDSRQIMYGIVLPGPDFPDGVPIVKGGDVRIHRLKVGNLSRTDPEIEKNYVRSRLQPRDIVYSIRGSIGDAEMVPEELEGANLTQDAARVAPRPNVLPEWLLMTLKSGCVFSQLEARAVGATIRGINIRDLKRAAIPVPPSSDQSEIASSLWDSNSALDELRHRLERQISLSKEHRAALISAAVTGQIDVRSEVAA